MTRTSASGGALTLSWCLVVALMMAAHMAAAQSVALGNADTEPLRFDLPAQPLEISLSVFGRLTGHSVLVASNLTAGREAAAVQGDFAPREALQRMLAGSGLAARYIGADAFTLVPVPSVPPSAHERVGENVPKADAATGQAGYATVLQASITRVLCIAQPDAFGRYRLGLQLWIDAAGLVNEARLIEGSGLAQRDALVLATLGSLRMDAPPPPGMAQPVTILLTPRADPARDCRPWRTARAG